MNEETFNRKIVHLKSSPYWPHPRKEPVMSWSLSLVTTQEHARDVIRKSLSTQLPENPSTEQEAHYHAVESAVMEIVNELPAEPDYVLRINGSGHVDPDGMISGVNLGIYYHPRVDEEGA